MTAEELFEAWRRVGGAYWFELGEEQQAQWRSFAKAVHKHANNAYSEGHDDGWVEGHDVGWVQGREA